MPRPRRTDLAAPYFHVVNRAVRRTPIFSRRSDYRAFVRVLREGLDEHPVQLIAYCILSNHWHLILEPRGTDALIRFMQWVTATHAIRWHHHHKTVGQGPVYQGRYHSTPLPGVADLVRACRYVERNALQAGLVRRAEDWPWCSLSDRVRSTPSVPLRAAIFLSSTAWIEHVNASLMPEDRRAIASEEGLLTVETMAAKMTSGTNTPKPVENSSDPLDDGAQEPGGLAGSAQRGERRVGAGGRCNQDHPDAHVERTKHLRIVDLPRTLKPREDRRHSPAPAVK
jgi:putative transposase